MKFLILLKIVDAKNTKFKNAYKLGENKVINCPLIKMTVVKKIFNSYI